MFRALRLFGCVPFLLLLPLALRADDPAPSSKAIAGALQPFVDSQSLAGAVTLVANRDKVLSVDTVGSADIAGKKPMKADSVVWIASMTKPITGAALMMLVDEGKVKLDDPVDKFLPEFKDQWLIVEQDKEHQVLKKPKGPVTVRHLMAHTSGLAFKSPLEQPTLDIVNLRDAVRSYALMPLQTEPGTKYQYSNAGINTAGRIIEVVSGMAYEDFLDKRLFGPLGMKDTTFWPSEEQVARLAKVYKPTADKKGLEETTIQYLKYPLNDRKNRHVMPGGGLFSTAHDVGRFGQMVLNGGTFQGKRYLTEAAIEQMTSKQTGDLKEGYGVGWSTGGGTYGHGGALATNLTVDPKRGLVTVFLVQHAGFPNDGAKSLGAFRKAAEEQFGAK